MTKRAVAVLGRGVVESDAEVLSSDDLGLTRGDGCFEATRVVTGADGSHRIDHLPEHLARFQHSSHALGLPDVDVTAWQELVRTVLGAWDVPGEATLKLMITRGRESAPSGPITGIATVTPLAERSLRQRRDGVSVITLARGTSSDAYAAAPWLLGGVKTLSYAINVAAGRFAEAHGADDVLFTTTDGYVLEAPTAAVVWLSDARLHTTPTGATGILDSITQKALFAAAEASGFPTRYALASRDELLTTDGVWLVSSGRGPARIHTLDGIQLPHTPGLSDRIRAFTGF
ncbi:aminodeoxychorismate lyase [Jatrophihabitans telluris]|uniref:Aminodeoxychorismate lyase n=1 Tax=Jatrophihabitans telluris TaxID=2038343 RepID=A0ABY4QZM4_9ACTN|nr:aminodeoxychorismate lyase [Jatrophihabitans telluris]UQX88783.1 aminodeoxychorismate lyase [Jatrophihabitans telluris]